MRTASIHRNVLLWALGTLALGACLLVGASWWLLQREMGEVFEDNLKQVALAVASHHGANGAAQPPRLAQQLPRIYEEYGKFEFVTQVWSAERLILHTTDGTAAVPLLARSGAGEVSFAGEKWHVYTIVLEDGYVQSAQRASERQLLARETASGLIVPALLMLGVIAGLLTLALRRGLAPLAGAAGEVTSRNVKALHPIPLDSHPQELHQLVTAINGLMARLGSALVQQRDLVADAAHELRTPVAALKLQLQLLERAAGGEQRDHALAELGAGVARAQHLIEQLLQLSRLGPEAPALQREPVELAVLARTAVGQFSARAEQQRIDLGAVVRDSPEVDGDAQQLSILLNNLIDNALRHTPAEGKVDVTVSLEGRRPNLAVVDSGPGIAPAERSRVFDRFYRTTASAGDGGSGLGLAIVKAVAERHGAAVALDDAPGGGLRVTVSFPGR
ncbi:MAG: ATP-binding protein [Ramlibacter sp.]